MDGISVGTLSRLLQPQDSFTMIRRGNESDIFRKTLCTGHHYQIRENAEWKPSKSSGRKIPTIMAFCKDCRDQRVVTYDDIIKDVVYQRPAPISDFHRMSDQEQKEAMFTTTTVELIDGIVGIVKFEGKVVWQSEAFPLGDLDTDSSNYEGYKNAQEAANKAKADAIASLFAGIDH